MKTSFILSLAFLSALSVPTLAGPAANLNDGAREEHIRDEISEQATPKYIFSMTEAGQVDADRLSPRRRRNLRTQPATPDSGEYYTEGTK
jgi:hypothetical protein